jgi:hypothetical protein
MKSTICNLLSLLILTTTALPAHSQLSVPSLTTLAKCSSVSNSYASNEQWQVKAHESCLRTPGGGRYIYYSATKEQRLVLWTSEGGNRIRNYTIRSVNLRDGSYIEYETVLGIRGKGFVNSMSVVNRRGNNAIPISNLLTVLEWERGLYSTSSPPASNASTSQSQQISATGSLIAEPGSRINLRDWAGMNAPIRHQGASGDAVTV